MATAEYVTDVTYVRSFEKELSPSRMRLVAALNGFSPPPGDAFDYCELGAAHGDTLIALAASNPGSRFVGVDLNREHVASGNRFAEEAKLGNVRFVERDFEALDEEEIPDLDYIAAHGVMSWVGPVKRRAILDFAARRLKPGGLLYASYNAMPGWAALEPLRQLLLSGGAGGGTGTGGDSLERARKGLAFAKQMNDAGAEYFTDNPAAQAMLATMEKAGLSYIVHEYLNAHWEPMYFAQMALEMASRDLRFVGQLPPYLNYRDLAIPKSMTALFERVGDRATFEGLKDFALNEFFRRDVYQQNGKSPRSGDAQQNGKSPRSGDAQQTYFEQTPFVLDEGTTARTAAGDRSVALPHQVLTFDGALFTGLFTALEHGAQTASALAARPELSAFGEEQIRAALVRMVLAGHVAPAQHATTPSDAASKGPAGGPGRRRYRVEAHNRRIIERALTGAGPHILASPVLGTGVEIPVLRAIAIRLRTEVPPGRHQAWIREHFGKSGRKLRIGGRVVDDPTELERLVVEELASFESVRLSRFVDLGILIADR